VDYVFQFGVVWREFDALLLGAWLTVRLSALAMALGLVVGVAGALATLSRWRAARAVARIYVEAIRNTPFLVQVLFVYLGLPSIGLRLRPDQAALLAMVINLGAYATEIVRAGVKAVPAGQLEAGTALGLSQWQLFRHVVWLPALRAIFPALGSQFILIMLASSVVSAGMDSSVIPSGGLIERIGLPVTQAISSGATPYSCIRKPRTQTAAVIW